MKKTIFLLLCLLIFNNLNAQSDPSVMEVNGQKVSKSEFLQIYLKNNNDPKFDKASIDEYMELFTCLLYTSPSPRDATLSRMPSSA